MGNARRAALIAWAVAGCLDAPPDAVGDGAADGDAGNPGCSSIVTDEFEGVGVNETVWNIDTLQGGAVAVAEGAVTLSSVADPAGSYASLASYTSVPVAGTVLTATFSGMTTEYGDVYFNLTASQDDEVSFYLRDGRLRAEYEVGGVDEQLCGPCPPYAGERVRVRVTSNEAQATVEWTTDSADAFVLLGTTPALFAGPVALQIETYSLDPATASVTVEEIRWLDCGP